MNVTKDVIQDLMPLYLAGEVSSDTRELVENFLRVNPELRPQLESALKLGDPEPPPDLEARALAHTRRLLGRRNNLLGIAIGLGYGIFSFSFRGKEMGFLLYRDFPALAWMLLALSAVAWILFIACCRRLQNTGLLAQKRSIGSLVVWGLGGAVAFLPLGFLLSRQFGFEMVRDLSAVGAFSGIAIGKGLDLLKK